MEAVIKLKIAQIGPLSMITDGGLQVFDIALKTHTPRPLGIFAVERNTAYMQSKKNLALSTKISERAVFSASKDTIVEPLRRVIDSFEIPSGWTCLGAIELDAYERAQVQSLVQSVKGLTYPEYLLAGQTIPHYCIRVWDTKGNLVSCGMVSKPFAPDSRFANTAYGGGLVVSNGARQNHLGRFLAAKVVLDSIDALRWKKIWAEARIDNPFGEKILNQCGFTHHSELATLIVH